MSRLEVTFHTAGRQDPQLLDELTDRIADALPEVEAGVPWLYDADLCAALDTGTVTVAASLRGTIHHAVNAPILDLVAALDTGRILAFHSARIVPDVEAGAYEPIHGAAMQVSASTGAELRTAEEAVRQIIADYGVEPVSLRLND